MAVGTAGNLSPPPNLERLAREAGVRALPNWGCGEGPASLRLQLRREGFGIGLKKIKHKHLPLSFPSVSLPTPSDVGAVGLRGGGSNPRCDRGSPLLRVVWALETVEGGNGFVNELKGKKKKKGLHSPCRVTSVLMKSSLI